MNGMAPVANLNLDKHAADSLALAVVTSSDAPILLLDGDLKIVVASASFCRACQIDPESVSGRLLFDAGAGEWDVPQLRSLLRATLAGVADIEAYEMDLKRPELETRRLVLRAHTLSYGEPGEVRMMLSVSDVTDARLAAQIKDDLLREKAVLLQSCSIASPTVCRSSPASCCRARVRPPPARAEARFTTPTAGWFPSPPCNAISRPRATAMWLCGNISPNSAPPSALR
jgi:hypothetical protein